MRRERRPPARTIRLALTGLSVAAVTIAGAACAGSNAEGRSPGSGGKSGAGSPPSTFADRNRNKDEDLGSGKPVTIAFGGDTAIEGPSAALLKEDPTSVFGPIVKQLGQSDLAFLNLETAIITGPATPEDKQFAFSTGPQVFDALRSAGVDGVTMANNHAVDFGSDGLTQTLDAIDADGFPVVGIGRDEAAAYAPRIFEANGQRIALLGTTEVIDSQLVDGWSAVGDQPGVSSAKRVDALVTAVEAARKQADTVIVFIHWGEQYVPCPEPVQLELAPKLVEAGADIVVGGHQHRVAGAGYLGTALVSYGLGNFLFPSSTPAAGHSGLLEVTVTGRRIDDYRWRPAIINDLAQPVLVPEAKRPYAALMNEWNALRTCTDLTKEPAQVPG